jgi:hypothetical protein
VIHCSLCVLSRYLNVRPRMHVTPGTQLHGRIFLNFKDSKNNLKSFAILNVSMPYVTIQMKVRYLH